MKRNVVSKVLATILSVAMMSSVVVLSTGCVSTEVIEAINNQGNKNVVNSVDIKPQDDFYGYVNAEYLLSQDVANNNYYDFGPFSEVQNGIIDLLVERIVEISTSDIEYEYGSKEYLISKAFNESLQQYDEQLVNAEREKELPIVKKTISNLENATSPEELLLLCIENDVGLYPLMAINQNPLDSTEYAIIFYANSSVIGADVTEVKENVNNIGTGKDKYVNLSKKIGKTEEQAKEEFLAIEYVAVDFCWATPEEDITKKSSPSDGAVFVDDKKLEEIFTNLDYKKIEEAYGISDNPYGGWITYSESQLKAIDDLYIPENLDALKNWAIFEFISANEDVLSLEYDGFEANKINDYNKEEAIAMSLSYSGLFIDEISMLYVEIAYDEEADELLRSLIDDVIDGYEKKITNASWLSDETKSLLKEKLNNIVVLTAKNIDTNVINTQKADCFTGNYWDSFGNLFDYIDSNDIQKLGSTIPKDEILMPMYEVNACYSSNNTVTITLAIQQGEFFSKNNSYAENLGGIGAIIGHEIGHAFDSNNMKYDQNGLYNPDWISHEDKEALESRNEAAITYFETAFYVDGIYSVDGSRTLGENYADLSGIEICVSLLDNEEDYKVFFETYARIWCELLSVEDVSEYISYDVHSPGMIRVNAILATVNEFIEVYGIKEGDGMYIAPEKRISRWN